MESEVEQLQGQVHLLNSLKEGKAKYRDALLEHEACLEGKIEAVGRLRVLAEEKGEEAEEQRRAVLSICARALGKRVPGVEPRQLSDEQGVKADLRALQQLHQVQSQVLLSQHCRLCLN